MTDQTRWGIPEVQMKNKIKAKVDQNNMRKEAKEFIDKCSVLDLQKIFKLIREIDNEN